MEDVERIAQSPILRRCISLDVDEQYGAVAERFATLITSPNLNNLSDLWVQFTPVGGIGLRALATSDVLAHLRSLWLSGTLSREDWSAGVGDQAIRLMLSRQPQLLIEKLVLHRVITPVVIPELLESPHLANLTELWLRDEGESSESTMALTQSPSLNGLSRLLLDDAAINAETVLPFCEWLNRVPLRVLQLGNVELDADAARAFFDCKGLQSLTRLRLEGATDDLIQALAASPHLRGLRRLELSCGRPRGSSTALMAIISSPHLFNLESLFLEQCDFEDAAAYSLLESPTLASLKSFRNGSHYLSEHAEEAIRKRFGDKWDFVRGL